MGIFDKLKSAFQNLGQQDERSEEEKEAERLEKEKQKEEERKRREEANRLNPEGKDLEWFSSEDGITSFKEHTTAQSYILEENIKKENEDEIRTGRYSTDLILSTAVSIRHPGAKIPYLYFKNLLKNFKVQPFKYVGPSSFAVTALEIQAKPFDVDDDGEPQMKQVLLSPEELVSVEKNPILNFIANFNCFEIENDIEGSWEDKYDLYTEVIQFLGIMSAFDKDVLLKNQWVFNKQTYFNDLGTVRKLKGFVKKALELSPDKPYFENRLGRLE